MTQRQGHENQAEIKYPSRMRLPSDSGSRMCHQMKIAAQLDNHRQAHELCAPIFTRLELICWKRALIDYERQ